jgi:hypothetical protein
METACRYPAGISTRLIRIPAPGMYVLEGTLVTHAGSLPPARLSGSRRDDGARGGADGDVVVVFITNKAFRIDYVEPVRL